MRGLGRRVDKFERDRDGPDTGVIDLVHTKTGLGGN
jgi:hypothetical protein